MRDRVVVAIGALALVAMALFCWRSMRVGSEITHFLPAGEDHRDAHLSRAVAGSELSRTVVVAVGAPTLERALEGARDLAPRLRAMPEVAWVRSGIDPDTERAVHALYFPRRHAFLSDDPARELGPRLTDEGLRDAAREVRRQLAGPLGSLVARTAGADPLLGFAGHLERLRASQEGGLTVRDGAFVARDGRHAVLFLATRASAFDATRARPFLQGLRRAFDDVNHTRGGALTLRHSGVHRIAVAAEAQIRRDTERVSLLSTLGVVALFLLVHRSLRYLALAALPIAAGTLVAMTAGLLLFGRLHGLTLAFGASLIGVCFDYPVYLINHHTLRPAPEGPRATLARVWPGIAVGAVTTMAGLAGLAWTSFPGLREIAVFSCFGVAGALATTRLLVTPLLPRDPIPVRFQRRLADALARAVTAMRARGPAAAVVPVVALALCAVGLPRVRWVDDARALTEVDPALVAEDRAVRELVSRLDEGRFVVALGATDEEALARNDALAARLADAKGRGLVEEFRSLHALLRAPSLQRRNEEALRARPDLGARAAAVFEAEGFRPGALADFQRALAEPPPAPLTYDALMASPLADVARPFRVRVGARVGYLNFLRGVRDPAAFERAVSAEGVTFFDQASFLRSTYGRYRQRTLQLMLAGLAAVFALVLARYRDVGTALAAFLPSVLASAAALAVVGLVGEPGNLLHLLGLLMVLSVGVDYGVFVAETTRHPEASSETYLSVTVAWVSTLLSFGLLGLSSNPALRAIGLTVGVGMTGAFLLAPVTWHLLAARRRP